MFLSKLVVFFLILFLIVPYKKIKVILPSTLDPYWVSGFIAGDGWFVVGIRKKKK